MVDGAASLMTYIHSIRAAGNWSDTRGQNGLDGGSHFYTVYPDERQSAHLCCLSEPKFYAEVTAVDWARQRQLTCRGSSTRRNGRSCVSDWLPFSRARPVKNGAP